MKRRWSINFALPPLVLHTFHTGNSRAFPGGRAGYRYPPAGPHSSISLPPMMGSGSTRLAAYSDTEIESMIQRVIDHGGLASYKDDVSGAQIPYELNINYFDALLRPWLGRTLHYPGRPFYDRPGDHAGAGRRTGHLFS